MARPLVRICPFAVSGSFRVEVGSWLAMAGAWQASNPDKLLDLQVVPYTGVKCVPTPVGRNRAVKQARQQNVDILFMIDEDMGVPFAFFEAALEFLKKQREPSAIGVPYCTAPPNEDVTVFERTGKESGAPDPRWKLDRIRREDAARREGIERVPNLGTGCIAYDLRVFDEIEPPWYEYGYNDDHTEVLETEDCHCHRRLCVAGVPLYVHWGLWAEHFKGKKVMRPGVLEQKHIDALYVAQAEANLRHGKGKDALAAPESPEECRRLLEQATPPAALGLPRPAFRDQLDAPPVLHRQGVPDEAAPTFAPPQAPRRIFTPHANGGAQ